MSYEIKLLVFAAVVALCSAMGARLAFRDLLPQAQYRAAWKVVGLTIVVSFMSQLTSIFFVGVAVTSLVAARMFGGDIKARVAAFLLLILLFPPVSQSLGGVADMNHLFILDHVHTLSLVLLGPATIQLLLRKRVERGNPFRAVDAFLIAYQVLQLALMFRNISGTAVLRFLFESATTILLPYYVMTRGLRSLSDVKFVGSFMMIGFIFLAGVGVAEEVTRHSIYSPLAYIYDVKWQLTQSLMRGGMLRVQATTPEPIVLAVLMIAALGLWTWLSGPAWRRPRNLAVYVVLLAALAFTWSRGPWLGAAVFVISLIALKVCSSRIYVAGLIGVACTVVVAKVTGTDQVFYDFLKSIFGSSESDFGTIEYRRQIMDASLALMQQSPLFGVPNYSAYLQDFKQGEGIIDLVNTYMIIGLNSGVIGLTLFLMPHLIVYFKLINRLLSPVDNASHDIFVCSFASVVLALCFTLVTTSTTGVISYILLTWIALPLVYMQYRNEAAQEPVRERVGDPVPAFNHYGR